MDKQKIDLVKTLDSKAKIVWIFWGGDGYNLSRIAKSNIFKKHTKRNLQSIGFLNKVSVTMGIKSIIKKLLLFKAEETNDFSSFLSEIDYCATWVEGDYDLVKKYYPNFKAKYVSFAYMNLIQLEANNQLPGINLPKPYLVMGNSATPSNNHLEIFKFLQAKNWLGNIACPLSYTSLPSYREYIISVGHDLFGNRFIPLTSYLDKGVYNNILKNAEFILINQLRQQASANIMTALYYQTPIVSLSTNTLINTLKSWGVQIADNISDIKTIDTDLNQKIIMSKMNTENIRNKYLQLLLI